jgi:hypothetical protein
MSDATISRLRRRRFEGMTVRGFMAGEGHVLGGGGAGGHRRISGRVGLRRRNRRPETTTITDDSFALRALLEKSADADLLREMIGFAAERLMELEVQDLTGAGYGHDTCFDRSSRRADLLTARSR